MSASDAAQSESEKEEEVGSDENVLRNIGGVTKGKDASDSYENAHNSVSKQQIMDRIALLAEIKGVSSVVDMKKMRAVVDGFPNGIAFVATLSDPSSMGWIYDWSKEEGIARYEIPLLLNTAMQLNDERSNAVHSSTQSPGMFSADKCEKDNIRIACRSANVAAGGV